MGGSARIAHNARRRRNREIKKNAVQWARENGVDGEDLRKLEEGPPVVAKQWALDRGVSSEELAQGVPQRPVGEGADPMSRVFPGQRLREGGPAAGGAQVAPVPAAAGPAPAVPAGGAGGVAPVAPGGGLGRGGRRVAPVGPDDGDEKLAPQWMGEVWCDSGVESQIRSHLEYQANRSNRDERNLSNGIGASMQAVSGGTNTTYRVKLRNGLVGYHKPFSELNDNLASDFGHDGVQQPIHEIAAWRLARGLGEPYSEMVPPCVFKVVDGKAGSFAQERPGVSGHEAGRLEEIPEWRDAAFFDALVGQQDRHGGNYLVAGDRPALIDHGYTFATPGDPMNYSCFHQRRWSSGGSELSGQEKRCLDRLLDSPDLMGLRSVLQPQRADALEARAREMRETGRLVRPGTY